MHVEYDTLNFSSCLNCSVLISHSVDAFYALCKMYHKNKNALREVRDPEAVQFGPFFSTRISIKSNIGVFSSVSISKTIHCVHVRHIYPYTVHPHHIGVHAKFNHLSALMY